VASWEIQDARDRFSELLETAIREGSQVVTRHGVEVAVLVPIEEWRRLQSSARPSIKELLLASEPRFDSIIEGRTRFRRRSPVEFN
jgi:antitoxin Phd